MPPKHRELTKTAYLLVGILLVLLGLFFLTETWHSLAGHAKRLQQLAANTCQGLLSLDNLVCNRSGGLPAHESFSEKEHRHGENVHPRTDPYRRRLSDLPPDTLLPCRREIRGGHHQRQQQISVYGVPSPILFPDLHLPTPRLAMHRERPAVPYYGHTHRIHRRAALHLLQGANRKSPARHSEPPLLVQLSVYCCCSAFRRLPYFAVV